ncbi:MAG: hypothetical protein KY458_13110, partial [Actinobacteria bacterium]|nr:hypothetical protein [Actinomycetota bacterium]
MALLVVLSLVAAACGGGNDTDQEAKSDDTEEATETKIEERAPGGTLVYGADQEPTGFNGNTSKDNGTSVKNVIENLFYYAVKATPDFGLDYIGLDEEPKVISESPQVIEWNIHKDAVWSDGTPVTTADIKYFWETMEAKDP